MSSNEDTGRRKGGVESGGRGIERGEREEKEEEEEDVK